jgi:hypothetical protein
VTRVLPWLLLGTVLLYRKTWGACQCDDLGRRLAIAHRETQGYLNEARYWRALAEEK